MTPNALQNEAARILDLYFRAELRMMGSISRRLSEGAEISQWTAKKAAELAEMNADMTAIVDQLEKASKALRDGMITTSFDSGLSSFMDDLKKLGIKADTIVPSVRLAKISAITEELDGVFRESRRRILRSAEDAYQRIIGEALRFQSTGVETLYESLRKATQEFGERGITGFVDKAGKHWHMAEYAEMALRTGMTNASISGYAAQAASIGEDLVIVTDHTDECPLCRQWENAILSLTGAKRSDPACRGTLDEAKAAGLFHAGCLHSFNIYVSGMSALSGGDKQTATQSAVGYQRRQKQRYMERQVRRWKRKYAAAVDAADKRECAAKAKQWQGFIREFTERYNLKRLRYRERIS